MRSAARYKTILTFNYCGPVSRPVLPTGGPPEEDEEEGEARVMDGGADEEPEDDGE